MILDDKCPIISEQVASAPVVYYYVPTFEGTVAPPSPYWALTQDGVPVLINAVVNAV